MSKDRDADMAALLRAVVDGDALEATEPEAVSPFAAKLGEAIAQAIQSMRSEGTLEVEDCRVDALVAEVTEAGLDTKSPKQLVRRVIQTLLASECVEEVYGTDEALGDSLRRLLSAG